MNYAALIMISQHSNWKKYYICNETVTDDKYYTSSDTLTIATDS